MSKPITLYGHAEGPNPWKIAILCEELGLKYETKMMDFGDLKKEPFESVNPNGRVPAIEDPNTGITLWESGAIIEYLIDEYDKSGSLHYTSKADSYACKAWLFLQVSGQGPYFGQKAWFTLFHSEKNITSVIERYNAEMKRVVGVIDRHLKKTGKEYLVGDKCTYADLAFVPWDLNVGFLMTGADVKKDFPLYSAWHERLKARPAVAKIVEAKAKASKH